MLSIMSNGVLEICGILRVITEESKIFYFLKIIFLNCVGKCVG